MEPSVYSATGVYTYVVGPGVKRLFVKLVGASGFRESITGGEASGTGGGVSAVVNVTPGDEVVVRVGGRGTQGSGAATGGGFNGGGNANCNSTSSYCGGGGGGATDIRIGGDTLSDRVLVAGGGGGGTALANFNGGSASGGFPGVTAPASYSGNTTGGEGGQLDRGGAGGNGGQGATHAGTNGGFGQGGDGAGDLGNSSGGGGGGGYYGGGGGGLYANSDSTSGGGGSNFADSARTSEVVHLTGVGLGNGSALILPMDEDSQIVRNSPGGSEFVVPVDAKRVTFQIAGASGGTASRHDVGRGGFVSGTFQTNEGSVFHVNVGGKATELSDGFNGGSGYLQNSCWYAKSGGGTDVRTDDQLSSRVLVAGAGGGVLNTSQDGSDGGYPSGESGYPANAGGGGGTQTEPGAGGPSTIFAGGSPGSANMGGTGGPSTSCTGGGGGGYFGGGGGSSVGAYIVTQDWGSGGGGSSYFGASAENRIHATGVNRGDGFAIVTPEYIARITSSSPAFLSPAGGTQVVLTGAHFDDVTSVTLDGKPVNDLMIDSDTQLRFYAPAHAAGPFELALITNAGQTTQLMMYLEGDSTAADPPSDVSEPLADPEMVKVPSVVGREQVGKALTADPGKWTGATSYTYEWLSCKKAKRASEQWPTGCDSIKGEAAKKLTLRKPHVGDFIAVRVVASNAEAASIWHSATVGPIKKAKKKKR